MKKLALFLLLSTTTLFAQTQPAPKFTATQLRALAMSNSPNLREAILANFNEKDLKEGTAWLGYGQDFFFAAEMEEHPLLVIDDGAGPNQTLSMQPTGPQDAKPSQSPKLWYGSLQIPMTGLHSFHYRVHETDFGGRLDLPAFTDLSYLQPGVPSGKLSDKITHTSKIYEGMVANYWIYVPAQYDPKTPAALMVFQDGQGYAKRTGDPSSGNGILNVIDNLIASKQIPVMICVFINPGSIASAPGSKTYNDVKAHADLFHRTLDDAMRSTLYDIVSDRYVRYLRDEILADVGKQYNLRPDAYSRAITGLSSGGICSFNAAWQMPDQFSRVITWIGSFTGIQWRDPNLVRDGIYDGGQDYPNKVMREPRRNIRVWLQDGSNDLIVPGWGDWAQANINMANALKGKDYDFHFSFSHGTHNPSHGALEFPQEMIWLWREYDPTKIEQTYQIDPEEKAKPYFRVQITNRNADL